MSKATLYTDGGARGNPGSAGCGMLIVLNDGSRREFYKPLGSQTNNFAEYCGLYYGLLEARKLSIDELIVRMDSELIVRQIQGKYKVKAENLLPLYKEIKKIIFEFKSFQIEHIPREQNKEADRLSNLAMDKN